MSDIKKPEGLISEIAGDCDLMAVSLMGQGKAIAVVGFKSHGKKVVYGAGVFQFKPTFDPDDTKQHLEGWSSDFQQKPDVLHTSLRYVNTQETGERITVLASRYYWVAEIDSELIKKNADKEKLEKLIQHGIQQALTDPYTNTQ